ncbi:HEAT repeat domain-containing protein [Candidatus Obscuribacterales bacterium]|nr:HEAT repeat domain-containing protein [Candidatus Obscuribacterales bacterium]
MCISKQDLQWKTKRSSAPVSVQYLIAGDTQLTALLLNELSKSNDPAVRARVAENASTPTSVLLRLLDDENADVRLSLSYNPSLPRMFLKQLATSDSADVRFGLAENPLLSPCILETLAVDENPYVALRAEQTLSRLNERCLETAVA